MRIALTLLFAVFLAAPVYANEEIDCENAMTQSEMNICGHEEFEAADAELNTAYDAAIMQAREFDEDENFSGHEDALRESQRAWIEYRDAACESETLLSEGGSIQPLLRSGCMTRLTLRRTEDLQDMYNDM